MSGKVSSCELAGGGGAWCKDDNENTMGLHKNTLEEMWESKTRKELIKDLQQGNKPDSCIACWRAERCGTLSARQVRNSELGALDPYPDQPRVIILKPGNLCNNGCRGCNPDTSTHWYRDSYLMTKKDIPYKEWLKQFNTHRTSYNKNEQLMETFRKWNPGIALWDMYGGEPLLSDLVWDIMKDSVTTGVAKDQVIQIHTNGTIYNKELIPLLKEFKTANLKISIDAIAEKNDYIRHGSTWQLVIDVLKKYQREAKDTSVQVGITCTMQTLNIWNIPETFEYFTTPIWDDVPFNWYHYIEDKKHSNICYMPTEIKKQVSKKLSQYQPKDEYKTVWNEQLVAINNFMNIVPPLHDRVNTIFWVQNLKLDSIRNQKFAETFPEWHNVWKEYMDTR